MIKLIFLLCLLASILLFFLYRSDSQSSLAIDDKAPPAVEVLEKNSSAPNHANDHETLNPKPAPSTKKKLAEPNKTSDAIEILMKEMHQLQGADYDRMENLAYQILELNPRHSYARTSLAIVIMKRDRDYHTGMNMLQETIASSDTDDAIIQEYVTASIYAGQETQAIRFLQSYAEEKGVTLPEGSISLLEYSRKNNDNAIEVEEGSQMEP